LGNSNDIPTMPPAFACASAAGMKLASYGALPAHCLSQGSLNMIAGLNPNACVSALNALLSEYVVWPIRAWVPEMLCRYASSCARGVPVAGGVTTGGTGGEGGGTEVPPATVKPWSLERAMRVSHAAAATPQSCLRIAAAGACSAVLRACGVPSAGRREVRVWALLSATPQARHSRAANSNPKCCMASLPPSAPQSKPTGEAAGGKLG
jgi:hypothetical protein